MAAASRMIAVPGTNSVYATLQNTIPTQGKGTTNLHRRDFPGEYPNEQTDERNPWTQQGGYWPSRSGFLQDPATPHIAQSQDLGGAGCFQGAFEPWQMGYGGNMAKKVILGRCKDADGNGISGAVVQGFLTAGDIYVGEATSDSNGYYEFGTPYPGQAHYLVAYRAGAPDIAGTTVNTLTPTNRDGT